MRNWIIAVIVAVALGTGISYWQSERATSAVREELRVQGDRLAATTTMLEEVKSAPSVVAIQVYLSGGACLSQSDPRREAKSGGRVQWTVRRAPGAERCFAEGQTVKIVPKSGNTSPLTPAMPFDDRLIKADVTGAVGIYRYEVWMADKAGTNLYMMEDPELEIVM